MATPPILFPLWPRPGVTETLEWLTYVMVSEDGTEERTEKRTAPRQAFSYRYFVPLDQQTRIKNMIYGARDLQWYVPIWPQVQNIGAVAAAATSLTCETRWSEFRAGGYALLWQSNDLYQLVEVDSVANDTTLNLDTATVEFTDAWLMPVRLGYLIGDPSRQFNGRTSIVDMAFSIDDLAELTVGAPTQFLSTDVYTDPGLLDGGETTEKIGMRVDVFDEGLGRVDYLFPWDYKRPQRVHRMMAENAEEAWAIRQFLHRRRGRSVAFYQPSFELDFRIVTTGNVTTSIIVRDDNFNGYSPERRHIAIETATGWQLRTVTTVSDLLDGTLQLIWSGSLGGISARTIKRICFMGLRRLDTDRVEINHIGGTVSSCAVNTVETHP